MVFVEKDSFRNLRRPPTDAFRSIPRLPLEDVVLPVAASDLVAWYPFRSGTGEDITAGDSNFGDTTDYSAVVNGPTFQSSGGVNDIQTGPNSGAFDFDGTDDTLDLGTVADSDQSLTVMTWVQPDVVNVSDRQRVITKSDGSSFSDGAFILGINGNGKPRSILFNNGANNEALSPTTISANQYVHLAGRYDFQSGDISLFINGQPVATVSTGQAPPLSSQPWRKCKNAVAQAPVDKTYPNTCMADTALMCLSHLKTHSLHNSHKH